MTASCGAELEVSSGSESESCPTESGCVGESRISLEHSSTKLQSKGMNWVSASVMSLDDSGTESLLDSPRVEVQISLVVYLLFLSQ